jgi:uncharacterized protein YndB with AHSA1/START domain
LTLLSILKLSLPGPHFSRLLREVGISPNRRIGATVTTTNIKSAISPDNDTVITEIDIAAPPARVFQALIDRDQALQWGKGDAFEITLWQMDARPAGKWRFVSTERKESAKAFDHHGEILQIDPPRLLEYSWFASWHSDLSHPTTVRWDLTPTKSGTHLKVTHTGLAALAGAAQGYGGGWTGLLTQIKTFIEK